MSIMAEKSTKNGKYAVRDIESLRAKVNREFLIRLHLKGGKSMLVGFTKLSMMVGELHAEHYAKKAISSTAQYPTFVRSGAESLRVVFCPR